MRPFGEIFGCELLESVGRAGRRARLLCTFWGGKDRRALEDHAARQHRDLQQATQPERTDCSIKGGGADALVLRQQVIRELVEVGDAADHGGARDHLVAVDGKLGEELSVFGIAFDKPVARVVFESSPDRPVLAEVVHSDDLVSGVEQLGDEVPADEPRGAGDEEFHALSVGLALPGRLTHIS